MTIDLENDLKKVAKAIIDKGIRETARQANWDPMKVSRFVHALEHPFGQTIGIVELQVMMFHAGLNHSFRIL